MWKKILIIVNLVVVVVLAGVLAAAYWSYYQKEKEVKRDVQIREDLYENILEGARTKPMEISVDFGEKQIAEGSPLIFGGSHTPPMEHEDAWDKIADVGVTSIRKDLYVEFTLPRNVSVSDYVNNKNDIRNPNNWDKNTINSVKSALKKIKSKGMKTIGIMAYAPSWLTFNHSPKGVPINWEIYKDIVKKIYEMYRDDLDYVEIWNEPDHSHFLTVDGSGYSREEAYNDIYYNASNAIREIDKEKNDNKLVYIGAAVESNPMVSNLLGKLLSDDKINIKPSFISFHNYNDDLFEEYSSIYKEDRNKYLDENTPIFITEWNKESKFTDFTEYKVGNKAILFTANRFLYYFKNKIQGANYFSILPLNSGSGSADEKTMGFYRWSNGKAILLPQARTWRILSVDLALGKGKSKIYDVTQESSESISNDLVSAVSEMISPDIYNSMGFENVKGEYGAVIVNSSDEGRFVEVNLDKTGLKNFVRAKVYYASAGNDASRPVYDGVIKVNNGKVVFPFYVPAKSVVGMTFGQEREWFENFNLPYIK